MNFTQDWFTYNLPHLSQLVQLLPAKKSFLEIGCFEGRATCWFLENALDEDGNMVCVDPFMGSMEHTQLDLSDLYKRFQANVYEVLKPTQNLTTFTETSYRVLAKLIELNTQFDFIYIDGDHTAPAVLTDACMAWGLLKQGGIMLFDDYHWNPEGFTDRQKPKIAVDSFAFVFGDQFKVVHDGYQIAVQKI